MRIRSIDRDLLSYVRLMATAMERAGQGRNFKYTSIADLLLKEGVLGVHQPYTKEEEAVILGAIGSGCQSKVKQCYYNAQSLAKNKEGLGYAEGYVWTQGIPVAIEHAWNVLPSGKPVDVTLRGGTEGETSSPRKLLDRARRNLASSSYLGIEMPAKVVRDVWLRLHAAVNLLEDPAVIGRILSEGYPEEWRTVEDRPSLSGRGMEEDWLKKREGKDKDWGDPTRSPYEGDIPPWAQSGYKGEFPLENKVFYVTAYYGGEPRSLAREKQPPQREDAEFVKTIGKMPSGVFYGSKYLMHPFAAIPVRLEDRDKLESIVDYVSGLLESLGAFGFVVIESEFPEGSEVRMGAGRWFPVNMASDEIPGISYVNAHSVNRLYGGPEEGGWWYNAGLPVASVPVLASSDDLVEKWKAILQDTIGWTSPYPLHSVLGHDELQIQEECCFAEEYPTNTPHYE